MLVFAIWPSSAMLSKRLFSTTALWVAPLFTSIPRLFSADGHTGDDEGVSVLEVVPVAREWSADVRRERPRRGGDAAGGDSQRLVVQVLKGRSLDVEAMFDVPVLLKKNIAESFSELLMVLSWNSNSVMLTLLLSM